MTARLADLTLTDVGVRLLRYRPVAIAAALTLATLVVLPDHTPTPTPTDEAAMGIVASSPDTTSPPAAEGDPAVSDAPGITPAAPTFSPTLGTVAPAPGLPNVPSSATPAPPDQSTQSTTVAAQIRSSAWATAAAGTPTATMGVPPGTLPIGKRLGQIDKASFLQLTGSWQRLVLDVEPGGERRSLGNAVIQACSITDSDWSPGEAQSFDDAPEWSPDSCVAGSDTGTSWTFDIAGLDYAAGVALVPGRDAPIDFQVTLIAP